jgi:hypothetical protein
MNEQFGVGNVTGGVAGGLTGGITNILAPGALFTNLFGGILPDMSGMGQLCMIISIVMIICVILGFMIYIWKNK